jgi:hypothetical protein
MRTHYFTLDELHVAQAGIIRIGVGLVLALGAAAILWSW